MVFNKIFYMIEQKLKIKIRFYFMEFFQLNKYLYRKIKFL
jgi:hypothetical protein